MSALRLLVLLLLPSAGAAHAQDLPPIDVVTAARPEGGTPLSQLIVEALDGPLVRAARAGEDAARARIDVERPWRSPHLRGGMATVDVSGARAPTVTTIEVTVPIEYDGSIDAAVAARAAEADAEHETVRLASRALVFELARRYATALEARVHAGTGAARLRRAEAILAWLERRVELGEGSLLDLASARLAVADARASLVAHEAEVARAERGVSELSGGEAIATGSLAIARPVPPVEELLAHAVASRPELRAAERTIEAAERTRDARHRARAPDLSLYVGWQHSFESLMSLFNQPEYDALLFGIDVEVPTHLAWDGELRESDALVAAAVAERDALERQVRREVEAARVALRAAHEETAIREAALADARTAAELVARALALGEERVLTLLAAERVVLDAIESYQHALGTEAIRHLELLDASGRDLDAWPGD
jgi:outer membrane protein TolC